MSASTEADVTEGVLVTTARPQPATTRLPKRKGKARKRQGLSVMIIRPEISSPGGGSSSFSRSRRNRTFCHGLVSEFAAQRPRDEPPGQQEVTFSTILALAGRVGRRSPPLAVCAASGAPKGVETEAKRRGLQRVVRPPRS